MPSFASDVKNALSRTDAERDCCRTAELAALLRMGASMVTDGEHGLGLRFETTSAAVARRVIRLLRAMDAALATSVAMERTPPLRRRTYIVNIAAGEGVTPLLTRLGFLTGGEALRTGTDVQLLRQKCCRAAYLRGAFLGGGSVNRPEARCHLEITAKSAALGRALHTLLRRLHFPVGLTDRRETYVVYLKESDAVMDFLALIGAEGCVRRGTASSMWRRRISSVPWMPQPTSWQRLSGSLLRGGSPHSQRICARRQRCAAHTQRSAWRSSLRSVTSASRV